MKPVLYSEQLASIISVMNAPGEPATEATVIHRGASKKNPWVSVIVPVYNVAEYLPECLDSICNQTLQNIEIICVDDGSTDTSMDVLLRYAAKDQRITLLQQNNHHAGVARNAGIAISNGQYLCILDSDDFFSPDLLEKSLNLIRQEHSDIIYYQYHNYDHASKSCSGPVGISRPRTAQTSWQTWDSRQLTSSLFTDCSPVPWNKLIRADLVKNEGIRFQSLTACNDVYFSLLVAACSKRVTFLYEPLVYYRHNRNNSLRNTRDKNPFNFWEAYRTAAQTLKQKKLFDTWSCSFFSSLISSSIWTYEHTMAKRAEVKQLFCQTIVPTLHPERHLHKLPAHHQQAYERLCGPDIIITLSANEEPSDTIANTLRCILQQNMQPARVILGLNPRHFPNGSSDIPSNLGTLLSAGVCLQWNTQPAALHAYLQQPDAIHIELTPGVSLSSNWLERLYLEWKKNPKHIVCHHSIPCRYDIKSRCLQMSHSRKKLFMPAPNYGILYPPHSIHQRYLQQDIDSPLALWLLSTLSGRYTRTIPQRKAENYTKDRNDTNNTVILLFQESKTQPFIHLALRKAIKTNGIIPAIHRFFQYLMQPI